MFGFCKIAYNYLLFIVLIIVFIILQNVLYYIMYYCFSIAVILP